jgi:hypothetical protein
MEGTNPFASETAGNNVFASEGFGAGGTAINLFGDKQQETTQPSPQAFDGMSFGDKLGFLTAGPIQKGASVLRNTILMKVSGFLRKVASNLFKYGLDAVQIAAYKFVIEFCALVMTALAAGIVGGNRRPIDITTPGVFWATSGPTAQGTSAPAGQRANSWDNANPFSDWNSQRPSSPF